MKKMITCNSGFEITSRATGETLFAVTAAKAAELEAMVALGVEVGDNDVADAFSLTVANVLMDNTQIDVYADTPETVMWVFSRYVHCLKIAYEHGKITTEQLAEIAHWEAKEHDKINTAELAGIFQQALAIDELMTLVEDAKDALEAA